MTDETNTTKEEFSWNWQGNELYLLALSWERGLTFATIKKKYSYPERKMDTRDSWEPMAMVFQSLMGTKAADAEYVRKLYQQLPALDLLPSKKPEHPTEAQTKRAEELAALVVGWQVGMSHDYARKYLKDTREMGGKRIDTGALWYVLSEYLFRFITKVVEDSEQRGLGGGFPARKLASKAKPVPIKH